MTYKKLLSILFLLIKSISFSQTTYVWNGTTSSDWGTFTNWTPNGVPNSTDNVRIVTAANNCEITSNTAVTNFTLASGSIQINTFTLNITGVATLTAGVINGPSGTLLCEGLTTTFGAITSSPTINPKVIVNSGNILCHRTTFNNDVLFTKTPTGATANSWRGGNTYNGKFTLYNTSNADVYIGANASDPVDVFNGRSYFEITGDCRIRIPQSGRATFNNVLTLYSNGTGGSADRIQPSRLTGAQLICNDSVYMTIASPTSDIHLCYDASTSAVFNGPLICKRLAGAAGALDLGLDGTVVFNNNVILTHENTGVTGITTGVGSSTLTAGNQILIGTEGFNIGTLDIDNFTQLGTTNQSLTLGSSANLYVGDVGKPCEFNATTVNFTAGRFRTLSTRYNGNSISMTKLGATVDDCGDNYFNGTVSISNSGNSQIRFSSVVAVDVFNSTLNLNNSGTGIISMSRTFDTNYPENIALENPSLTAGGGIIFGDNGGTSALANNKTISVGAAGYNLGYLYLYRFTQLGTTPQNIDLTGTGTLLRLGSQANITSGCTFQTSNFTGTASLIELGGNIFAGTTLFNQTGNSATARIWGGNTFAGPHTVNVSGTASIQMSQLIAAENYSSTVTFNVSSTGSITASRSFNTNYPENIILTSTSTGNIGFGLNGGSSTLANGKTISIGASAFTGNNLYLYNFIQVGSTPQVLNLTGATSAIHIGNGASPTNGCIFGGNLTASAPNFTISSNTFNGICNFTKTGGTDDNSNGNNIFNGSLTFANTCTTSGVFVRMSNVFGPDTYNGITTLSTDCPTGGFVMARTFDGNFNNNIICNSSGGYIYLGAGNTFTGTANLAANRTISCGTFDSGRLILRRFAQVSNTAQNIVTTGNGQVELGGNTTDANTFTNFEGDLTVNAGGYVAITNSTFQRNVNISGRNFLNFVNSNFNTVTGSTSLSRVGGTTNDDLGGGNTINGNFIFNNSGSGRFRTGITAYGGDSYNGNVTINNSGTGVMSFAYNNTANSINGNLNLTSSNTGSVIFGEAATANATTIGGIINAASGNYTNGTINLRYVTQNGGSNSVFGTASAVAFTINQSTINGGLYTETVGTANLLNSTFNNTVTTSNSGASTATSNTFQAIVTTTNSGATSFITNLFNNTVTTNNSSTTTIRTNTLQAVGNFSSTAFVLGGTTAQGNIFNSTVNFTKTGTSNDDTNGGNVFNDVTTFNSTNASGRWRIGASGADDFNANVFFNQNAAGALAPAYGENSTFAANINLSSPAGIAITFAAGTSGRVTMDGTIAQFISKSSGNDPNFTRFTVDKISGDVTLNTRVNVVTDFNPTSGVLNTTNANIINLNNSATTTIGNSLSYVNGPMQYAMATNSTSRRTLNLPIGKSGDWRPAVLQVSHTANTNYTYKAEVFNADANALGWTLPATVSHVSYVHYWDIDRFNTSTLANASATELRTTAAAGPIVTLYYDSNDGVTDPANLTICKNTAAASTTWFDIGGAGATVTSGNVTSTSSPTAFNSFSRFTLGNLIAGTNPLPIELISFDAKLNDKNTVDVFWTTATEINNDYFDVERSADGTLFEHIATIKSEGNSYETKNYFTIDENPNKGINYYRLKQVDIGGKDYSYSAIVSVIVGKTSNFIVYPNPTKDILNFNYTEEYENANITITNTLGAIIKTFTINDKNQHLDLSDLSDGIYYLSIEKNGISNYIKINKTH